MSEIAPPTEAEILKTAKNLPALWGAAVAAGVVCFGLALYWAYIEPGLDWVWAVAAAGVGIVGYNLAFFALCASFAPAMAKMVRDDTEVKGDAVTQVVEHGVSGEKTIDAYLPTYANARGISAVAITSAILATVALTFF